MRSHKITVWEEPAKEVAVRVEGIDKYKEALLCIFNNVRDRESLWAVTNDSGNTIYVTCDPEEVDAVTEWVSQWGEIEDVADAVVFRAEEPPYNYNKYEDAHIVWED